MQDDFEFEEDNFVPKVPSRKRLKEEKNDLFLPLDDDFSKLPSIHSRRGPEIKDKYVQQQRSEPKASSKARPYVDQQQLFQQLDGLRKRPPAQQPKKEEPQSQEEEEVEEVNLDGEPEPEGTQEGNQNEEEQEYEEGGFQEYENEFQQFEQKTTEDNQEGKKEDKERKPSIPRGPHRRRPTLPARHSYLQEVQRKFPKVDVKSLPASKVENLITQMRAFIKYLNDESTKLIKEKHEKLGQKLPVKKTSEADEIKVRTKMLENKEQMIANQRAEIEALQKKYKQNIDKDLIKSSIDRIDELKDKIAKAKKENMRLQLEIKTNSKRLVEESKAENRPKPVQLTELNHVKKSKDENQARMNKLRTEIEDLKIKNQSMDQKLREVIQQARRKDICIPENPEFVKKQNQYEKLKEEEASLEKVIAALNHSVESVKKNSELQSKSMAKQINEIKKKIKEKNLSIEQDVEESLRQIDSAMEKAKDDQKLLEMFAKQKAQLQQELETAKSEEGPIKMKRSQSKESVRPKLQDERRQLSLVQNQNKHTKSKEEVVFNIEEKTKVTNTNKPKLGRKEERKWALEPEQAAVVEQPKKEQPPAPPSEVINKNPFKRKPKVQQKKQQHSFKLEVQNVVAQNTPPLIPSVPAPQQGYVPAGPRRFNRFGKRSENAGGDYLSMLQEKKQQPVFVTEQPKEQPRKESPAIQNRRKVQEQKNDFMDIFKPKEPASPPKEEKGGFKLFKRNRAGGEDEEQQKRKAEEKLRKQEQQRKEQERLHAQEQERVKEAQLKRAMMGGGIKLKKQNKFSRAEKPVYDIFAADDITKIPIVEQPAPPAYLPPSPAKPTVVKEPEPDINELLGIKKKANDEDDLLGGLGGGARRRDRKLNNDFWGD